MVVMMGRELAAFFSCSPLPFRVQGDHWLLALHVFFARFWHWCLRWLPSHRRGWGTGAGGGGRKGSVASTDANFREQYLPQMYFSNVRQTSRLRVLVVSDIHTNVEAIVLLNHWLAEKRIVVDFVLVSGDMADMDARDQTVAEKLEGGAGDVSNVLHNLEKIKCRVYYVPGNHDPAPTMTLGSPNAHAKLTPHSTNMLKNDWNWGRQYVRFWWFLQCLQRWWKDTLARLSVRRWNRNAARFGSPCSMSITIFQRTSNFTVDACWAPIRKDDYRPFPCPPVHRRAHIDGV